MNEIEFTHFRGTILMIQFTQVLTDNDYTNAGAANYNRSALMKVRFALALVLVICGLLLAVIGIPLLSGSGPLYLIMGILFFCIGVLRLLRKRRYLKRLCSTVKSDGNYGKEIRVQIDDDGMIELRQGKDENRSDLRNFHGYGVTGKAILLYPQKNLFLILNKESIGDDGAPVIRTFEELRLKRLY